MMLHCPLMVQNVNTLFNQESFPTSYTSDIIYMLDDN